MRVVALGVLGLGLMPGGAWASSILMLGDTPTPAPTPSIVMFGETVPAVTGEKVSAIPEKAGPAFDPMVIRGGIVGHASAAAEPTATDNASKPRTLRDAVTEAAGNAPAMP